MKVPESTKCANCERSAKRARELKAELSQASARIMDALSSAVAMTAKSRHLFRDFIDATAEITITEEEILVRFQERAHNPLLIAADFHKTGHASRGIGT